LNDPSNEALASEEGVVKKLCPNCCLDTHVRCCAWCGKIHGPRRVDHEHCSAECAREAAKANEISAQMEDHDPG
jgi:hypothetical protein